MARRMLLLEFALVFVGAPLLVAAVRLRLVMALVLWAAALWAWRQTRSGSAALEAARCAGWTAPEPCSLRFELRGLATRFAVLAPLLTLLAWVLLPQRFMTLPLEHPWRWAAILLGYPVLSVWPQEVLYRRFLRLRYAGLFGTGTGFVAASGLAFGFGHVLFLNLPALVLSTAGGLVLASGYARHRSLPLVCLEHALYGCLIFTVGLGRYFYTGAAWQG